jgi:hypothetical protein
MYLQCICKSTETLKLDCWISKMHAISRNSLQNGCKPLEEDVGALDPTRVLSAEMKRAPGEGAH